MSYMDTYKICLLVCMNVDWMLTITIKNTFFLENEMFVNINIWGHRGRGQVHDM